MHSKRCRDGIEVQILIMVTTNFTRRIIKGKGRLFSTNRDVFPTGTATLTHSLRPLQRPAQFSAQKLSKGGRAVESYYVRGIRAKYGCGSTARKSLRKDAKPPSGYLCLESERFSY